MATDIRLKKSSVSGRIPSSLDYGEVALNYQDGVLYYKNSSNVVQKLTGNSYLQSPHGSTITFVVTVATKDATHRYNGTGSGNGYKIDGVFSPFLTLVPGRTYRFDQSDNSNSGHPINFYYDAAKTVNYSTGVTVNGVAGNSGAYTEITVSDATPTVLHYQCTAHGYMGNSVQTNARNLTGFDTDDLTEGSSNLYYTVTRANTAIDNRVTASFVNALGASAIPNLDASKITSGVFDSARIPAGLGGGGGGGDITGVTAGNGLSGGGLTGSVTLNVDSANIKSFTVDSAEVLALIDSAYVKTVQYGDNEELQFGALPDLRIFHNGTHSFIRDVGAGQLRLTTNQLHVTNGANNETQLTATANGSVDLYYDNAKKLETLDSGVNITGNLRVNNAPFVSGSTLTIQDEGSALSTAATTLNFVGAGVTATGNGAPKTINITGGSGGGGGSTTGSFNQVLVNSYTGDSSTTAFTLSAAPASASENNVIVTINGIVQHADTYSLSGSVITLDSAPLTGDAIEMRVHDEYSANVQLRDYKSYVYTPSTNTTAFTGADANGNTLTYDLGHVEVYLNGARLVSGLDYTETSGSTVTLDSAIGSGDTLEIASLSKAAIVDFGVLPIDSDFTTTTADQIIHTFAKTDFRTVKYIAQIEHDSDNKYHSEEILLTHNGTNVGMTTYAQILLDSNLGTFDADISGSTVRLKFTPTYTNTSVKLRAIRTSA